MLLDLICIHVAYCIAFAIRFSGQSSPYLVDTYRNLIIAASLIQLLTSFLLNSYSNVLRRGWLREFGQVLIHSFSILAVTSLYLYSMHNAEVYSRLLVYYTMAIYLILDWLSRMAYKKVYVRFLHNQKNLGKNGRSLLIMTDEAHAEEIIKSIENDVTVPFRIAGIVLLDDVGKIKQVSNIPVVATVDNAGEYICKEWIDELLVYLPTQTSQPKKLLDQCAEMGITVHVCLNLRNADIGKEFIEEIGNRTVLTTAYNYMYPHQVLIKRTMDIVGGVIGSILAILIGVVIGPIIFIQSPGPVLFKQKRVGKNGKLFNLLKFRSMYLDAEERKKELEKQNRNADGMMFKMKNDPRVIGNKVLEDGTRKTGIGDFIRRTSLDEFPQFFNVLKGEMSLVGTRPPTIDEWERYQFHHRARLAIKPGITGLWQVSGRSDITDFEEVVKLDTEYIVNFKLSLDIKILFKTLWVFLKGKGAY